MRKTGSPPAVLPPTTYPSARLCEMAETRPGTVWMAQRVFTRMIPLAGIVGGAIFGPQLVGGRWIGGLAGGIVGTFLDGIVFPQPSIASLCQGRTRTVAATGTAAPITGGLQGVVLPDGQPLTPPATPGDLAAQQMVESYIDQREGAASEVPDQCVVGPGGNVACGNSFDPQAFANLFTNPDGTTMVIA